MIPDTGTVEVLTSVLVDTLWHAIYPTADLTLCGIPARPLGPGRRIAPTCGRCGLQSRRFDRIDSSMPNHWRTA